MRKIIVFDMISLDGFFARLNGDIDWHRVDDEFNQFAIEQTSSFGALIFGRTTYQIFEKFWPAVIGNSQFSPDDQKIADIIQNMQKIVFSKTLDKVTWQNTQLYKDINASQIQQLKAQSGQDMAIFGSGTIVQAFTRLGLVDEYRLMVNPVILGEGKPLFKDVGETNLRLLKTREFKNGNVLLYYQPE